jgi:large subunit ribosomal protein L6
MSRIAKSPITVPKDVTVNLDAQQLTVNSKRGELSHTIHSSVRVNMDKDVLTFTPTDNSAEADAFAGTTRALVNNMIIGLSRGFERKLTLVGVGYRAQLKDSKLLSLSLGYSHPVEYPIPEGITIESPSQTEVIVKGADKQLVGQVAANIRSFRPPEPYKGKGVRYADEVIIMKEAKKK